MKYQGSKRRVAKYIIPIMLENIPEDVIFYDVCCGGGNLVDKVPLKNRIAIDVDEYVIEALKAIRDFPEKLPKNNQEFTEEDYKEIKNNKEKHPKWLVGYVGYALSWGGKWFDCFRRDKIGKRDYVAESYRDALKQSKNLQGVKFICKSYDEINYSKNSIIYVDPPYQQTKGYKHKFNHDKFWQWVRKMSKIGYKIFVSEYTAPNDFVIVWEKQRHVPMSNLTGKKRNKYRIEKLFVYRG